MPNTGKFYGNIENAKEMNMSPFNREKYVEQISKLPTMYIELQEKLRQAYQRGQHSYNLRKRPAEQYHVGDKVWKRNFTLSNAANTYSAKLAPKFLLCTVKTVISPLVYRLADENGTDIGCFHQKDLKPFLDLDE